MSKKTCRNIKAENMEAAKASALLRAPARSAPVVNCVWYE